MIAPNAPAVTPALEIQGYAGDPNFMASLARGLAVIRAFTQQRRHLTIAQVSQRTAIPRAAVRRCLYTLSMLGYVGTEDGRTYALRPRILVLGHAYLSSTPLVYAVQPLLDQITSLLHESSSLAVLEGDEILYIARSSTTTRLMSIDLGIGSRLPAYCTSMGRVLLAGLSAIELDLYLS
ncbi:MAG TPA: helix-turn-helix domain-containing protein, partial [Casimicrobiaceae bacterium]